VGAPSMLIMQSRSPLGVVWWAIPGQVQKPVTSLSHLMGPTIWEAMSRRSVTGVDLLDPQDYNARMSSPEKCPFCGSLVVIDGNVLSGKGGHGFRPRATRGDVVFSLRIMMAFEFGPAAQFCPECCMVWSQADPRDAAKFMAKFGADDLKALLATIQVGGKAAS
jgi:hypothetical protein